MARDSHIPYGRVGRPHGVGGVLVLHPFNPGGADLAALALPVGVRIGGAEHKLVGVRRTSEGYLVRLEGIEDRDAAAGLTNRELQVPRAALPPLAPGEVYVADLVGCEVLDLDGRARGVVRSTFWNGAQDVLSVVGLDGQELLVPVAGDFIREIDLEAGRLVVDPHE